MRLALGLFALVLPRLAAACPVCFGAADNRGGLAQGFWWGIVILLAITMSLLAAIGWTLWTVERRRTQADA